MRHILTFISLSLTAACSTTVGGQTGEEVKRDGGGGVPDSGKTDANKGGTSGSGGARSSGGSGGQASGSGGAGTTMFCGIETCGPDTKCCPGTGRCIDPNGSVGCAGFGCAAPNGAPPPPDCCGPGFELCPASSGCVHTGCENCCPPDIECNQQADCPSGFSCCYNTRRCFNPLIDECGGGPPKCATDGSCPGNMVCCTQHQICYEPGCADCCPSQCAPPTAHCSQAMPCCNGGTCCSGVPVPPGGEFCASDFACPISDRNRKHAIAPVDPEQVLERVAAMSISEWSYNDVSPSARHIGPMAQDFHQAFGTGDTDTCIPTVDANGVALAAIQALYRRVSRLEEESQSLHRENTTLRSELDKLRERR